MSGTGMQVAIVTGAASGIGRAIANAFAENRYRVFLFDNDCEALRRSVEVFDPKLVSSYCGDVSNSGDVKNALVKCLSDFGWVDVLVSNVGGILSKTAFLDMDEELWDQHLAVNLKGVFLWGQAVAKWMVEANSPGKIINISCMRTELVAPNLSAYSASKGGVKALTKLWRWSLRPTGMDWDDLPAIMDLNDLAEFLDVGYRRALELAHTKGFPALRIGRGWRVNRDGLRRWLDRQTQAGG